MSIQNLFDERSNLRLLRGPWPGDVKYNNTVVLNEPPERRFSFRKSHGPGEVKYWPSVLAGKLNGLLGAAGQNFTYGKDNRAVGVSRIPFRSLA